MQPTLAPAPHPPHQHLQSPQAQVQQSSYLKEEINHGQTLIEGWDDQQETEDAEQGQSSSPTACYCPGSLHVLRVFQVIGEYTDACFPLHYSSARTPFAQHAGGQHRHKTRLSKPTGPKSVGDFAR